MVGLDVRMNIGTYLAQESNSAFSSTITKDMVLEGAIREEIGRFYDWKK